MIIGWIYSNIEPKLRPSISLVDSAKAMWGNLQGRFSVNDDTRIHQLHADIVACKQGGDSVEEYFGKLKVLWDDLADFDKGFTYYCKDADCASMLRYEKSQEKNSSDWLSATSSPSILSSPSATPQVAATRFGRPPTMCSHCEKSGHEASEAHCLVWGRSVMGSIIIRVRLQFKLVLRVKLVIGSCGIAAPSYANIKTFGTLCYARRIARNGDKFGARGIRCLFLGYPLDKKGLLVFDLTTEKTFASRDVIFHEDVYPYVDTISNSALPSSPAMAAPHPALFDDQLETGSPPTGGDTSATSDTALDTIVVYVSTTHTQNSPEMELRRDKQAHIRSVLLKPYVTYASRTMIDPSHTSPSSNSEPSSMSL
ncbi:unnamed protein product, partial [Arabidopsis halleri]